ncbi:MAG: tRNA modification GTPase [Myxococcota bacterium]|jgi:tRNA modification GTPase
MVKTGMHNVDTICALATSAGVGGVGIVRISGPESLGILRRVTARFPNPAPPLKLCFTRFVDGDHLSIDEGFAVFMPGPRTFTGEDVAELHTHGGSVNIGRVLRSCLEAGARSAERGEFTLRSFLNGRMDLARAEAVIDVVQAPTESALDIAHRQLRGGLSRAVSLLLDDLLGIHARLEAQIDFVDDDLEDLHEELFGGRLRSLRETTAGLASSYRRGRVLRDGARVVLAGIPNAGKSSLFNALLRSSRAIVTEIPGTTRDFIEERADLGGIPVTLVDTAGLRDATDDVVEAAGVDRAHALVASADLVLLVSDARLAPPPLPTGLTADRVMRVRTKADLADGDVSVVTGQGLDELAQRIVDRVLPAPTRSAGEVVVTNARHFEALRAAEVALARAEEGAAAGCSSDLLSVDVREALDQLGLIVGKTTTEDLLDRIFGEFCIGK